jgi:hypothetical protein
MQKCHRVFHQDRFAAVQDLLDIVAAAALLGLIVLPAVLVAPTVGDGGLIHRLILHICVSLLIFTLLIATCSPLLFGILTFAAIKNFTKVRKVRANSWGLQIYRRFSHRTDVAWDHLTLESAKPRKCVLLSSRPPREITLNDEIEGFSDLVQLIESKSSGVSNGAPNTVANSAGRALGAWAIIFMVLVSGGICFLSCGLTDPSQVNETPPVTSAKAKAERIAIEFQKQYEDQLTTKVSRLSAVVVDGEWFNVTYWMSIYVPKTNEGPASCKVQMPPYCEFRGATALSKTSVRHYNNGVLEITTASSGPCLLRVLMVGPVPVDKDGYANLDSLPLPKIIKSNFKIVKTIVDYPRGTEFPFE